MQLSEADPIRRNFSLSSSAFKEFGSPPPRGSKTLAQLIFGPSSLSLSLSLEEVDPSTRCYVDVNLAVFPKCSIPELIAKYWGDKFSRLSEHSVLVFYLNYYGCKPLIIFLEPSTIVNVLSLLPRNSEPMALTEPMGP